MLVLSRKCSQKIYVDVPHYGRVEIMVTCIGPHIVRIGVTAPPDALIVRAELVDQPQPVDAPSDQHPQIPAGV